MSRITLVLSRFTFNLHKQRPLIAYCSLKMSVRSGLCKFVHGLSIRHECTLENNDDAEENGNDLLPRNMVYGED